MGLGGNYYSLCNCLKILTGRRSSATTDAQSEIQTVLVAGEARGRRWPPAAAGARSRSKLSRIWSGRTWRISGWSQRRPSRTRFRRSLSRASTSPVCYPFLRPGPSSPARLTRFWSLCFSGIVKCVPGVANAKDDPVLQAVDALKEILATGLPHKSSLGEVVRLLDRLTDLCSSGGGGSGHENASIAVRNGAVELLCSVCSSLESAEENALASALKALSSVLCGPLLSSLLPCAVR